MATNTPKTIAKPPRCTGTTDGSHTAEKTDKEVQPDNSKCQGTTGKEVGVDGLCTAD